MGGWVGGWLENEFLKKTPSPKFGLESQLGTSDLEFVNNLALDKIPLLQALCKVVPIKVPYT